MAFVNFRKSCICVSAFCLAVSVPFWSMAATDAPTAKGPATVTSVVKPASEFDSEGQTQPKLTDPSNTTYHTSAKTTPKPTDPATSVSNLPGGVSSKSRTFNKKSSININDHVVMVSASMSLGLLNGKSRETVINPTTGHKNSELIWNLDNVAMLGIGGSVKPLSWLRFNGNVWFKISDGDGYMDDYDWMATNYDGWTHWSHSKDKVTEGLIYDLNMELTFLRFRQTSFFGIVGYRHDHWKWEAYGGHFIYSTYYIHDTVFDVSDDQKLGTYEQTYDVPYIGIGFHANLDPVTLSGRFIVSNMVKVKDKDQHLLRDFEVTSSFDDGKMYGFDFSCTYNLTQNIAMLAAMQYTKFDEIEGTKDWFNYYGQGELTTYGGGTSYESTLFYLSALFTF